MNTKVRLFCITLAHCLLCVVWISSAQIRAEHAYPLAVAIYEDIYSDYQRFMRGRDVASISYYGGDGARRDVIEIVLLQQALLLGGFKEPLELRNEKTYLHTLRQIATGELISSGALVWYSDILDMPELFNISQQVINDGEFIAGFYTSPDNHQALAAKTLEHLRALRAVSTMEWHIDLELLKKLDVQQIYFATDWLHIVRMLKAHHADFTLAPFQPTAEMKILVGDMQLIPIKGMKVFLPGTRHWPVSRKHPRGEEYYAALQKGISLLKQQGRIQRAYEESGFFHPEVKDWQLVGEPVTAIKN